MTTSHSEHFIKSSEAILALGSNLGDRIGYLERALKLITQDKQIHFLGTGDFYETLPQGGPQKQGHYINTAIAIRTEYNPTDLLNKLREIEDILGRERTELNAPRTIDLDIILYENTSSNTKELTLPHPHFHERSFVLLPLRDVITNARLKSNYWDEYRTRYKSYDSEEGIISSFEASSLFRRLRNFS